MSTQEILNKFLALPEKDRDELILLLAPWTNLILPDQTPDKYKFHMCETCGKEMMMCHLNSDLECAKCVKIHNETKCQQLTQEIKENEK